MFLSSTVNPKSRLLVRLGGVWRHETFIQQNTISNVSLYDVCEMLFILNKITAHNSEHIGLLKMWPIWRTTAFPITSDFSILHSSSSMKYEKISIFTSCICGYSFQVASHSNFSTIRANTCVFKGIYFLLCYSLWVIIYSTTCHCAQLFIWNTFVTCLHTSQSLGYFSCFLNAE